MIRDPQQPAGGSPRPVEPTGFFTGVKILPVVLGVVVDVVATYAALTAYWFLVLAKRFSEKGISEETVAEFWLGTEGLITSLVIGALGTAVGGYFAASRAGQAEVKHGALVGFGSILLGLIMDSGGAEEGRIPEWFLLLGYLLAIPMGALGGYVAESLKGGSSVPGGGSPGIGGKP